MTNINLTEAEVEMIQKMRAEEARKAEEIKAAEEAKAKKNKLISWMATSNKIDLILVTSALSDDSDDFNNAIIELIINKGNDLAIGIFVGTMIQRDLINELIKIGEIIKSLKEGGLQSSITVDHLLECIEKFC